MTEKRPHAVEMTERVVSDLLAYLRMDMPDRIVQNRECSYELSVHIRDGIIQLVDVDAWTDDHRESAISEQSDVVMLLRQVEKWLFKTISMRLVCGYHGRVIVLVGVEGGGLVFRKRIVQQTKYNWRSLKEPAT